MSRCRKGTLGAAEYPSTAQAQQTVTGLSGHLPLPPGRLQLGRDDDVDRPDLHDHRPAADRHLRRRRPKPRAASPSAAPSTRTARPPPIASNTGRRPATAATSHASRSLRRLGLERGAGVPGSHRPAAEHRIPLPLTAQHTGGTAVGPPTRPSRRRRRPRDRPSPLSKRRSKIAGGYKLQGQVNPNSIETTYHFEFGIPTGYGTNLPGNRRQTSAPGPPTSPSPGSDRPAAQHDLPLPACREQLRRRRQTASIETFTTAARIRRSRSSHTGDRNLGRLRSATAPSIPTGSTPPTTSQFGITESYGSQRSPPPKSSAGSGHQPGPGLAARRRRLPPGVAVPLPPRRHTTPAAPRRARTSSS